MYGSCFCIHSASLCLLVGTCNAFIFKVIIDTYVPITIFLIVLGLWFFKNLLNLFIYGCVGSLLLRIGFLYLRRGMGSPFFVVRSLVIAVACLVAELGL